MCSLSFHLRQGSRSEATAFEATSVGHGASQVHVVTVTPLPGTMARGCGTCFAWGTESFFCCTTVATLVAYTHICSNTCSDTCSIFFLLVQLVLVASFDAWCWALNSLPHHNKITVEHWQTLMTSQAVKVICFHREAPRLVGRWPSIMAVYITSYRTGFG